MPFTVWNTAASHDLKSYRTRKNWERVGEGGEGCITARRVENLFHCSCLRLRYGYRLCSWHLPTYQHRLLCRSPPIFRRLPNFRFLQFSLHRHRGPVMISLLKASLVLKDQMLTLKQPVVNQVKVIRKLFQTSEVTNRQPFTIKGQQLCSPLFKNLLQLLRVRRGFTFLKEGKEEERRVVLSEVLKHEVNEGDYNAGLK